jgi:RsiW-degrading membrane proteinase PrsW (M82 family)
MSARYWQALTLSAIGLGTVTWGILGGEDVAVVAMLIGAAAIPMAVLLVMADRLDTDIPWGSLVGGATIGPLVAVASHAFVFGFAYLFFLGFAEEARALLEAFRLDPTLVEVAGSPWTMLFFFELVLVAPLTEEVGKALGGLVRRPSSRADAFMAGVAAGVGFAAVENVVYASGGLFVGPDWEAIVAVRMLGTAVHPLASGLVVMGWWEWRQTRDSGLLLRRFLTGAGVHALWNASTVVLGVVGEAYGIDTLVGLGSLGVAYGAGLGALALALLWRVSGSVAAGREVLMSFDGSDIRTIGGWLVITATMLIPVALLSLGYPEWVGSG